MPRGRHRHSPPLHRLLPPSAIAGVSLVCAFGPWVFSQPAALRIVAAIAAATALVGAAFMRRWDTQAGKQVADLIRARTSDEWRYEERLAELESDLDESRELRVKLEHKLRAKRTELAGLRNEHAALLRRYATAETERASALEGRRLLEIEAAEPARALPPVAADDVVADVEPEFQDDVPETDDTEAVAASVDAEDGTDAEDEFDAEDDEPEAGEVVAPAEKPAAATVFSPEGSKLFLRAKAALVRHEDDGETPGPEDPAPKAPAAKDAGSEESAPKDSGPKESASKAPASKAQASKAPVSKDFAPKDEESTGGEPAPVRADSGASESEAAQEDEAEGKPEAVDGHEHAAAVPPAAQSVQHAQPAHSAQPSGHFTVPTAVAVVPAAPVRRPMVEGGFDFFGMQKGATSAAMDAVQNEDLADVVGQEALAVHKAEAEAQFKPADDRSRDVGVGQVIDLTAHDETEQINLHGLRSAAS
ncbi:hypothetical protein OG601_14845 [Streptomyces sp. NBC_01239]|uniref:hypothetical protein n=1 Tax=Streptomyces sp. NBC_01239 TaxID=2903792 RepID=UPI00224EFA57|nr:hypothetical protein [Streptomyces sp. NBC_01239]MCX4811887.1 hypothetical protein [Streptomyces sp. NBC_01239]